MAADELKPAYLIAGGDRPKVARALARLRERFDAGAIERLSAAEANGEEAVAACNAMGLFGGGARLVIVDEVERWRAADATAVAGYLGSPAPDTVLALVAGEVKRDSALAKAVRKVGDVLVYDVQRRALPAWVEEQFKRAGANVDRHACRALVELVGENPEELAAEIEKLAAWAAGDPITEDAVLMLAAGRAETSIFALTDAWGRRDVGAVLGAAEALLERAGSRRDELPRLVGLMASHVGRVRQCQDFSAEGLSARDAASRLKRSPYYVEKLFAQAQNFSVEELREAIVRLAELDLAVKGGSRLSGELELARALVDLTRERQPAAA